MQSAHAGRPNPLTPAGAGFGVRGSKFRARRRVGAAIRGLTLAVGLSALTACSSSDTPEPAAAAPSGKAASQPSGKVSEYGPIQDVLQAGTDWETAETATDKALSRALARCMAEEGYSVTPPVRSHDQLVRDGYTAAYGTDLADEGFRKREGYGVTSGLVGIRSPEEPQTDYSKFVATLSVKEQDVFFATSSRCADKARKSALPAKVLKELNEARADLDERMAADARLAAARAAWATCMRRAGFTYENPDQPLTDLDAQARPFYDSGTSGAKAKELHALELRIAAADWKCRSTTITPTLMTVRQELEGAFIQAHPDLVERVRAEMKRVIGGE